MKQLLYFLVGLLLGFNAMAQNTTERDSLLQLLKTAKEDSSKVLLLLSIGEQYENDQPEVAKMYYNQLLLVSRKIGYKPGEIKYASYYTAVLNMQGKADSSLLINLNALQLAKTLNDPMFIIKTSFNVANSYNLLDRNDSTIYYYMQTMPLLEKLDNKRMLAMVYNNLCKIYRDIGQYQKGIDYGEKAIPIWRTIKDSTGLEYGLTNLGVNYNELKDRGRATTYFKEALLISYNLGDKYAESVLHLNLGDIAYQQGNYEECKSRFEKAFKIADELDLFETKAIALKGFGMYYLQTKNYKAARNYADSALVVTQKNNLREQRLKVYNLLSSIAFASQDLTAANEYGNKATELQDSINNDNLQKVTTNFEKKYEAEKKDAQIKEQQASLHQRRLLNYLFAGIALALLIIAGLGYRNFKHRQQLQEAKITELETERQLTATEAVLKGEEQERTRLARDLHDGLGGMLSGIKFSLSNMKSNLIMTPDNAQAFERSIDMLDSSIREMRRVAHNMMPEMLVKYGLDTALKEFCNEVDRSGALHINYQSVGMSGISIDQTTGVTIYRIVQELVNNTIKHAQAENVLVQLHHSDREKILAVTVEDDGKGFDANTLGDAAGMGWRNIRNRVEFLKGSTDIQSVPGKGTSVMIQITV